MYYGMSEFRSQRSQMMCINRRFKGGQVSFFTRSLVYKSINSFGTNLCSLL
jgi:hypothetical protein